MGRPVDVLGLGDALDEHAGADVTRGLEQLFGMGIADKATGTSTSSSIGSTSRGQPTRLIATSPSCGSLRI